MRVQQSYGTRNKPDDILDTRVCLEPPDGSSKQQRASTSPVNNNFQPFFLHKVVDAMLCAAVPFLPPCTPTE